MRCFAALWPIGGCAACAFRRPFFSGSAFSTAAPTRDPHSLCLRCRVHAHTHGGCDVCPPHLLRLCHFCPLCLRDVARFVTLTDWRRPLSHSTVSHDRPDRRWSNSSTGAAVEQRRTRGDGCELPAPARMRVGGLGERLLCHCQPVHRQRVRSPDQPTPIASRVGGLGADAAEQAHSWRGTIAGRSTRCDSCFLQQCSDPRAAAAVTAESSDRQR